MYSKLTEQINVYTYYLKTKLTEQKPTLDTKLLCTTFVNEINVCLEFFVPLDNFW